MEINLLMSAVGGDVACATLRALKKENICSRIIGFDMRKINQGLLYVDEFVVSPPYSDEAAYEKFVFSCCKDKKITHFWPITETEILWANKKRKEFENIGVALMINNEKIIDIATSKYKTACFLKKIGVPALDTIYMKDIIENYDKKLPFPVILKNDFGCGSHGIKIIETEEEWKKIEIYDYEDYVIQKYINSETEYTVGVFSNRVDITSIIFKRRLDANGMSVEVETLNIPEIHRIAEKVAKELKLDGSINMQMKETDGEYYIFEINPRVSSTVGFRALLGHNDAVWWLDSKAENKCKVEYHVVPGIIGIKVFDDLIIKGSMSEKSIGGGG